MRRNAQPPHQKERVGREASPSEWCAAVVVAHLAVDDVDAAEDCKAVVQERAKPLRQRLRPSSVHAGQSRELLRHISLRFISLRWVKATSRRRITSYRQGHASKRSPRKENGPKNQRKRRGIIC